MKKQNGITLIVLVVTIVVLLILAGVSLSMVFGNNGIATKAREASTSMNGAALKEYIANAINYVELEAMENNSMNSAFFTGTEEPNNGSSLFDGELKKQGLKAGAISTFTSEGNYAGTAKDADDNDWNWTATNGNITVATPTPGE